MAENVETTEGTQTQEQVPAPAGQPLSEPTGQPETPTGPSVVGGNATVSEETQAAGISIGGQTFTDAGEADKSFRSMQARATRAEQERQEALQTLQEVQAAASGQQVVPNGFQGEPPIQADPFSQINDTDPQTASAMQQMVQQAVGPLQEELQAFKIQKAMETARGQFADFGDHEQAMVALQERMQSNDPLAQLETLYKASAWDAQQAAQQQQQTQNQGAAQAATGTPVGMATRAADDSSGDDNHADISKAILDAGRNMSAGGSGLI